jgi:hypothetical protein
VFRRITRLVLLALATTIASATAQQATSSINQSRLFTNPTAPGTNSFDENGNALPDSAATSSEDDSFGTQLILKNQERPKSISLFGDVSGFYTTNVDLTPEKTRSDFFLAANAGGSWRPILWRGLIGEISLATSMFRYDKASELDFERFSAGTGVSWAVPHTPGIIAFGRYDFSELLDWDGHELLQDHEFTIGGQKTFVFNRTHFLTTGIIGTLGLSSPRSQERDQAGINAAYHLQITRSFDADLLYRYAAQFYTADGRIDHNQVLSLGVGYYPTRWLRASASISAARNDSNRPAFEYEVLTLGGGIRFEVRF